MIKWQEGSKTPATSLIIQVSNYFVEFTEMANFRKVTIEQIELSMANNELKMVPGIQAQDIAFNRYQRYGMLGASMR